MSNLKQLKCPSCGATLNQNFPDQLIVECPYCHQQVVNTDAYKNASVGDEPRILEFNFDVKDVVKFMVDEISNDQSVPTDIFDKMRITSTKRYYVPMYIFEGTFRAPWTSEIERQEKRQRINREGKVEDYYETLYDSRNGEAVGNFSFNSMSSKELNDLGLDIKQLQYLSINAASLPLFSTIEIKNKDIGIIPPSGNSESVWWESGESAGVEIGIDAAHTQAPGRITSCSASCELKKSSFVYIPLWIIEYNYDGAAFNFYSYAEIQNVCMKPSGKIIEALPTEEQQTVLDKFNKRDGVFSKIRNLGCLGISLIGFIGCWGLDRYRSAHYLDKAYNYYGHANDASNFLLNMVYAGIALLIVMTVIKYIYRRKNGIDNIEEDIANRTRILQTEADKYRKETGKQFLNKYATTQSESDSDNSAATLFTNPIPLYDANPAKTKTCIRCSKQIEVHHMYCRYCGAKQN